MKYQLENCNGNYDFRCNCHDGWIMESHLHEYSELLYCKAGSCDVVVNGREMTVPEKHLIWLPPHYIHRFLSTRAQVICAVFSNDFIPLYFRLTGERRLITKPVAAEELSQILERFPAMRKENPLEISGWLHLICAKVLENANFETQRQGDGVLYQKVISYLSKHFQEDISLGSIARRFGYNEKYLSHALHELTGIHFSRLLALYRVEYARKLLAEQRSNISAVAMQCGFSAVNSFNRVFREMTGLTPSAYRKNYGDKTI